MEPTIRTFTGKTVNPLDLSEDDIDIRDIAHALALCNRFAGHTRVPYSVAQHSVYTAVLCPEYPLTALLHDASEAYLGDVTKWVKQSPVMLHYREVEERIQKTINKKFGCLLELPPEVIEADKISVRVEAYRGFLPPLNIDRPGYPDMSVEELTKYPSFYPWSWETAETRFLNTFAALNGKDRE